MIPLPYICLIGLVVFSIFLYLLACYLPVKDDK